MLKYHRSLLDLPGDLEDILQVLHANTGAEIYAIATWRRDDTTFGFHE